MTAEKNDKMRTESLSHNLEIAKLLFPNVKKTPYYYDELYPPRSLPEGAIVTRFAPSPTGFVHIGGIYATMIAKRIADQTKGVFYLRIEDTDKKREVEGGIEEIVRNLINFDLAPEEGVVGLDREEK